MREDLNSLLRRTRIVSGFILFFYAATHLLNHSLATFSISTADAAREYFIAFGATRQQKFFYLLLLLFIFFWVSKLFFDANPSK